MKPRENFNLKEGNVCPYIQVQKNSILKKLKSSKIFNSQEPTGVHQIVFD